MKQSAAPEAAPGKPHAPPAAPKLETLTMAEKVLLHPLFSKGRTLPTLPINEVFLAVRRAVLLNETGYVFTGHSGIGKTFAIEMVKAMLQSQFPRLCMFTHDAHHHQIPSIRAFFKHFLDTVGHTEQRGETYDLRARLVRILVDDARLSGINRIVMFIDEASAMLLTDFLFLKDVHNDLGREGVQLITVLMGQSPDMEGVIAKLRRDGRRDLVNRFATRVVPIRGYDRLDDVRLILKGIDGSFFPEHSTTSWTSFFLPKACRAGFTLENEAEAFFDAICKGAAGQRGRVVFPARPTFLAIREYLLSSSSFDSETVQLPRKAWTDAVEYAMVHEAMEELNARTRKKKKSEGETT